MSLSVRSRACFSAAVNLGPEDTSRFLELHAQYEKAGASETDAARSAADDLLAEMRSEAAELGKIIGPNMALAQGPVPEVGASVAQAEAAARELFGDEFGRRVRVVATADDLPTPEMVAKVKADGGLAVTINSEFAYIVADRIAPDALRGVLLHEVGVHIGMKSADIERLTATVMDWTAQAGQLGDMARWAVEQAARSTSTNKREEVLAYMVQVLTDSDTGVDLKRGAVADFLRTIREWVQSVMRRWGYGKPITPRDMVEFAHGAAQRAVRGQAPKVVGNATPALDFDYAQSTTANILAGIRGFDQTAARNLFLDATTSHGGSGMFNPVNTQYAKAKRNPTTFGPVFDAVQDFIKDVSVFANAAADLAPNVLPKLDSWRDVAPKFLGGRGDTPKEDLKAAGAALWRGTLTDLKVYSPAELTQMGLTPAQRDLYYEQRAAIDQSLDDLVRSELVRMAGAEAAPVRAAAMAAPNARAAADVLGQFVAQLDPMSTTPQLLEDKLEQMQRLKDQGYAPLMRFGRHTVHITDAEGASLYFGMYESRTEANRAARELRADPQFDGARFQQGLMSQESYKLFQGMNLDSLELFADTTGNSDNPVYQDFLKLTKSNRSALKRMIHRQGIAGYSEDSQRVLAAFITSNARAASGNLHLGEAKIAAEAIPKELGDVRDDAINLVEYVQTPKEEAGLMRGLLFVQFIGGSIASAAINLTQSLTMTLPYLSQFGGAVNAARHLKAALAGAAGGELDPHVARAMKRAEDKGIVSPQEIHHLQAEVSQGSTLLRKAGFVWGSMFSLAEQFNRRITFIAAYNAALEQHIDNPQAFAERAVIETQGLYNKGNKPNWARGAIGSTVFTFKQFSIHYLEFLSRMARSGPEGKKAATLALGILIMVAGAGGLPFADDLDDLIDTLAQALGYDYSNKRGKRAAIKAIADTIGLGDLGDGLADVALGGVSKVSGVPIDVSLRMGMGNLLPATGILLRSNTDRTRDVLELGGAAGSLARTALESAGKLLQGDVAAAGMGMAPLAIQNLAKAAVMWNTGEYRDTRGRKVTDVGPLDAAVKAIGFQPAEVARESATMQEVQRSVQLAKNVEGEIAGKWAQALRDNDADGVSAAREALRNWNERNDASMKITMTQILRRVRELRDSRIDRAIRGAPKEMRGDVREAFGG